METAMNASVSRRPTPQMIVFAVVVVFLAGSFAWLFFQPDVRVQSDGYTRIDLKAMSSFPFDQANGSIEDIPKIWREQNGKQVVLYGEMWQPQVAAGKISNFELVYSIAKCCFSGPPQIQHFVQAKVVPGKTVDYYDGLVKVTGTLRVNVIKGDGRVRSVYQLEVESVEQG